MTEEEWLTANDPTLLLSRLVDATPRKLRLFGVACCRRLPTLVHDPALREAIITAEQYADGWERRSVMVQAGRQIRSGGRDPWIIDVPTSYAAQAVGAICQPGIAYDPSTVLGWIAGVTERTSGDTGVEETRQAELLRDIFGNPFRPVILDPSWRTSTAKELARTMYESRDFAAMPILADALEEAGCNEPSVLAHCRGDGPHVRGCWVVDLVLSKS